MLPAQTEMADSQSKQVAGEVEVFVEPLARQRDSYLFPNQKTNKMMPSFFVSVRSRQSAKTDNDNLKS